ncbi:hypothetical protein [Maridesulfovibrio frigidus]|uniref:hypothetical protein n=1 Tax=Maridesulfovibrio frigidus TaxID=340956 RepID=UPI0004E0BCFB|nr:hypothetical protein [Maridesulfovibrio frigidus]
MDSREVLAELNELGTGKSIRLIKQFLELKILEEKDSLVTAAVDKVPQTQGKIQGLQEILDDLTPVPETGKSQDAYS